MPKVIEYKLYLKTMAQSFFMGFGFGATIVAIGVWFYIKEL